MINYYIIIFGFYKFSQKTGYYTPFIIFLLFFTLILFKIYFFKIISYLQRAKSFLYLNIKSKYKTSVDSYSYKMQQHAAQ